MEKFTIRNEQGEKIVGVIYDVSNAKGTAIVQHGLSGSKDQPHIIAMAQCCVDAGWRTIIFDSRHTFGESDGNLIHATMSSYCDDLALVIEHHVPADHKLILLGHSLGGASILHYTCQHPDRIAAIAPAGTIVSQELYIAQNIKRDAATFQKWQDDGRYLKTSSQNPDQQGYVSYDLVKDFKNLKILESLDAVTMPALFIVGDNDVSTPPDQQELLYKLWQGPKEFHVIPDCEHTFRSPAALAILQEKVSAWLEKLAF